MHLKTLRLLILSGIVGLSVTACDSGQSSKQAESQPSEQAASSAASCNRDCLKAIVDQFLDAIVAHDASKAPFAATARYTENGQQLALNDGFWATASSLPDTRIYAAEPDNGAAVFFGRMKENDIAVVVALRLKVENKQITQAEMFVARPGERLYNAEGMTPQPIFEETEDPATRSSRQELIDIANKYFDGIEQATGSFVPFDDDCIRIENGEQTVKNVSRGTGSSDGKFNLSAMGCKEQFNTGFWAYITAVRPRRYEMVDAERGLVFGVVNFDHSGTVKTIDVPNVGTIDLPPRLLFPYESVIGELFKIRNGKILKIEALVIAAPYKMPSGWE